MAVLALNTFSPSLSRLTVTGQSGSDDFPLKDPVQREKTSRIGFTPVLLKVSTEGDLLFSTFFGGRTAGGVRRATLDSAGNIYIVGSADRYFATRNAYLPAIEEGFSAFLAKFNPTGREILYASFLDGAGKSDAQGVAVDASGNVYVSGWAGSAEFPLKDSFQTFRGGGFYNSDCFLMKFAPSGRNLIYATLLGGRGLENGCRVAVDPSGDAYVSGFTGSIDLPTYKAYQQGYGGGFDGFLAKIADNTVPAPSPLTPSATRVLFRFTQGGPLPQLQSVAVAGPPFIATPSASWLTARIDGSTLHVSAIPGALAPGTYAGSITLRPDGAPPASVEVTFTVLAAGPVITRIEPAEVVSGSDDTEVVVRGFGFTRETKVQFNGQPWLLSPVTFVDAGILRFKLPKSYLNVEYNHTIAVQNPNSALSNTLSLKIGVPALQIAPGGIVNAASFTGGVVSPGEIVTIFGSNFGSMNTTRVLFDELSAELIYVLPNQLSATVPLPVRNRVSTSVVVESEGYRSAPVPVRVVPAHPALFAADASGKGQGAILNQDASINGASNPAERGSIIVLYGTGGGPLTADELPRLALPVKVFIDGIESEVLYAGIAPGLVTGAIQINVRVPGSATAGKIVFKVGNVESNVVKVALK